MTVYVAWPLLWNLHIVEKVHIKHHVAPEEVDEVIFYDAVKYRRGRVKRVLALGQTEEGRYLVVVLAKVSGSGQYQVVTARNMNTAERRSYRRMRGLG